MINSSLKAAVAVAMLAGVSVGANATEKDLGNVAIDVPTSFNGSIVAPGAFNDIFSFVLPSSPSAPFSGYTVENFPLTTPGGTFNTLLTSLSLVSNPDGILFNQDDSILQTVANSTSSDSLSLSWTQPLQGNAYLSVAGVANGTLGGLYNGAISVSPVPEPEAFAMLLAGLGLMGAVVRRRSSHKTSS